MEQTSGEPPADVSGSAPHSLNVWRHPAHEPAGLACGAADAAVGEDQEPAFHVSLVPALVHGDACRYSHDRSSVPSPLAQFGVVPVAELERMDDEWPDAVSG